MKPALSDFVPTPVLMGCVLVPVVPTLDWLLLPCLSYTPPKNLDVGQADPISGPDHAEIS